MSHATRTSVCLHGRALLRCLGATTTDTDTDTGRRLFKKKVQAWMELLRFFTLDHEYSRRQDIHGAVEHFLIIYLLMILSSLYCGAVLFIRFRHHHLFSLTPRNYLFLFSHLSQLVSNWSRTYTALAIWTPPTSDLFNTMYTIDSSAFMRERVVDPSHYEPKKTDTLFHKHAPLTKVYI